MPSSHPNSTSPEPQSRVSFSNTREAFTYKSTQELQRAALLFRSIGWPVLARIGPRVLNTALGLRLPIRGLVRRFFFDQFCGGYNLPEAQATAQKLYAYGVRCTLDYAVEALKSTKGYEQTKEEILKAIRHAKDHPEIAFVAIKLTGLGNLHALAAAQPGLRTVPDGRDMDQLVQRLEAICQYARDADQPIMIDAEESWIQDQIDQLAERMMLTYNTHKAIVYTTIQMYRHDRLHYLKQLAQQFAEKGVKLGVKLVRGAYLETEHERARVLGYPTPMQPSKAATDADYDAAASYILSRIEDIALCAGTHSEKSCAHIVQEMEARNLAHGHPHIIFSQLYGMSDHISFNLARAQYNVSKYLPYGPLEETMPYLFRRASENTSIAGQSGRELALIEQELARRKKEGRRPSRSKS
ncbi:MAG: proline dehydrogenase family protein [Bacteroidetes bacterium]|jgi:proline dehydrogenase|nr:proline dehydrogenase family protein [Bacteroidota bacterium]